MGKRIRGVRLTFEASFLELESFFQTWRAIGPFDASNKQVKSALPPFADQHRRPPWG